MRLPLLTAVCLVLRPALAVFADEAWSVDYHHALLGEPKQETTFFHQPSASSRASLVYTLSDEGVLGAVNPRDGVIVWRQVLTSGFHQSNASFLRAGEGQDVVVSGLGNEVAAWSAADGRLAWSVTTDQEVTDVEILEVLDARESTVPKDTLILAGVEQAIVQRIDGATGVSKWQYRVDNGDSAYQLSASTTEIFVILLHKTILGYIKIKVVSLDPLNGHKLDEYTLSSENELASTETIIAVGANSASPIIAWTDATHTVLKVNVVGSKSISSFAIDKRGDETVLRVYVHAPYHTTSLSHFLVHYEGAASHWADVFHVDLKSGKVSKAYSLPKLAGKGAFSTSTSAANVYFTRITNNEVLTVSSASHGVLGRWPIPGFGVVSGVGEGAQPIHAVSEVSVRGDAVSAVRTAVLLSTGDWALLRDGTAIWHRPEMLAGTLSAGFASSTSVGALAYQLEAEIHGNPVQAYIHRVSRHLGDLQQLPKLLASMPQSFARGVFGTTADSESDTFGFHQVIACATKNGRLVGLDAGKPDRILWNEAIQDLEPGPYEPSVEESDPGLLTLRLTHHAVGQLYNASTGERMMSIPTTPNARKSQAVKYTVVDGSLEATLGSALAWHFTPNTGERIVSLAPRPVNDPVASIGKVLGDRKVLYKYLDPNVALLATVSDARSSATFYVINTVSGGVLHSSTHAGVDLSAPITSMVSENWFAYSLTADSSDNSPKGVQLVVGELFESLVSNDRGALGTNANFSSIQTTAEPFTLTHTYQISEAISKLAVTRTRQGITSRQLLAVLAESNAIVGIPYGALDPRRPAHREPTKDEQAEGLLRYAPVIEFDPKWYLNHKREVIGVRDIVTSPALIESTSLVFAYGLDIFGTRLTPSFSFDILGKDFNKFQMLATVAALAVATFVVAPLVSIYPYCATSRD